MSDESLVSGYLAYFKATSNKWHKEQLLARIKEENPKVFKVLQTKLKEKNNVPD